MNPIQPFPSKYTSAADTLQETTSACFFLKHRCLTTPHCPASEDRITVSLCSDTNGRVARKNTTRDSTTITYPRTWTKCTKGLIFIPSGFSTLLREHGYTYLWRGWSGKLLGYGVQGGCRFGLYEYFKTLYANVLPNHNRTSIYFLSSASAQIFADMALCPFEAIKVRVQTQPRFAKGLLDGFPRVYRSEGLAGFHRGIFPLWCRNLPFSMVMFSTFEQSVEFIYQKVIHKRKQDCSIAQQLGVTCLAGYTAGAVGTVVSNPADVVLSSLYNNKAKSVLQAVRNIGFVGLFTRSLPVRITIVGPVITLQWFFYDAIKVLSGFPTSGGVKKPVDATKISV